MAVVSKGSRRPFDFEGRLLELGEERLPKGGELCPFEVLPADDCVDAPYAPQLARGLIGLDAAERRTGRHRPVYSEG